MCFGKVDRISAIILIVLMLLIPASVQAEDGDSAAMREEIRLLRDRLQQLEGRLSQQEKTVTEQKKTACEVLEKFETINTRLKERIETEGPCWYKTLALDAAATGVAQGAGSLRGQGDRTDGNLRIQLGVTSTGIKNGAMRLELRQGEGTGLTTEIASFTGINDTVYPGSGNKIIYEAWYQHRLMDNKVSITAGKMDFTNYFDSNEIAHCECTQFLASGFVWNPAVEWAENSLGAIINFDPSEKLYLRLGALGTNEWENVLSRPFAIAEIGISNKWPGEGNYRFYGWVNAGEHRDENGRFQDRIAGITDNPKRGWGFGLSFDQAITEEIGLFLRGGYQDDDLYAFDYFISLGGQLRGKRWNRPEDAVGIAYGIATLSDEYKRFKAWEGKEYLNKDEGHLEVYYRIQLNDKISISPDFQVLFHPEGDSRDDNVYLGAIRGRMEF